MILEVWSAWNLSVRKIFLINFVAGKLVMLRSLLHKCLISSDHGNFVNIVAQDIYELMLISVIIWISIEIEKQTEWYSVQSVTCKSDNRLLHMHYFVWTRTGCGHISIRIKEMTKHKIHAPFNTDFRYFKSCYMIIIIYY